MFLKHNKQKREAISNSRDRRECAPLEKSHLARLVPPISRGRHSRAGFTIIELLVAMALFITIMIIVSVIFIISIRSERGITALIAANDNVFLTLEQMAREIRVGRGFAVSVLPPKVSFTNTLGDLIEYSYVTGGSLGWIERSVNGGPPQKITADNVNIRNFQIVPKGEGVADGFPTRITLALSVGTLGVPSVANAFTDIQTTITVRNLDN